jgi:hypothetical protein
VTILVRPPLSGLIVKRASASGNARPARNADDFDGLAEGVAVERIFKANAASGGMPWIWTLAFGAMKIARQRMATLRVAGPQ